MNPLYIKQTEDTPEVYLDTNNFTLKITGPCFPEDAISFYQPIIDWVREFKLKRNANVECIFDYSILSSASNKAIYELFIMLEEYTKSGINVNVKWYYESFDEDMKEEGEGYRDSLDNIPFDIISK